jgi:aminoglycoside phosphotransferase family enzyme/cytidylate kinase
VTELHLNQRTAPDLYLGLAPVRRAADGTLVVDAPDPAPPAAPPAADIVEAVVVMVRFDQDQLLSAVSARGALGPDQIDRLAATIAAFHANAEPVGRDPVANHRTEIRDNTADLRAQPDLFDPPAVDRLDADTHGALEAVATRLNTRAQQGLVRRCHGDLHLRNIVLLDGEPRLFDAIEFNDALAEIDVLYDLAFLLMDLDQRGQRWAANRLLTRYLARRDDLEGLAALPLFLSLRAAIRAKVGAAALASLGEGSRRADQEREARGYFAAARDYLSPPAPRLVAIGGVSGTGKTTVARALAPEIGAAPGALVIRSDVERKRLLGVAETERLPESAYQGKVNADVYARMLDRARRALAAGQSVVLEATFLGRSDRAAARKQAEAAGVPFAGVFLTAPPEVLEARVAARTGDASDATAEVVRAQLARAPKGEINWPTVDASGEVDAVVAAVRRPLRSAGVIA